VVKHLLGGGAPGDDGQKPGRAAARAFPAFGLEGVALQDCANTTAPPNSSLRSPPAAATKNGDFVLANSLVNKVTLVKIPK
jgi:hypothetical protein